MSTVSAINSQADVWSEHNYHTYSAHELISLIEDEELSGNFVNLSQSVAKVYTYAKLRTFYRAHLSRATKGRNFRAVHKPFFNFLRYSRFVLRYNSYMIGLYPQIVHSYYSALDKFIDKYLFFPALHASKQSYIAGITSYAGKFKRSPVANSTFSRDRSRRVRKKYKNYHKDLFSYAPVQFNILRASPDVFHSNFSYRTKTPKRTISRFWVDVAYNKKLGKRMRYHRFFSNSQHYQIRRRRNGKRHRRFFPKSQSPTRYTHIFNDKKIYYRPWLQGHLTFNRAIDPNSRAMQGVRAHEIKFQVALKKLGERKTTSLLTERFDVQPATLSSGFILNYYTYFKPKFKYYNYSPITHAFIPKKFKLMDVTGRASPTTLNLVGFDHDDEIDFFIDFYKVLGGISRIEDFNRVRLFRAKKRAYKPFFYRYLFIASNRRYRKPLFFKRLEKKFSKEFLNNTFIRPISREFPPPTLKKTVTVYYTTYKGPDPYDPSRTILRRRIKVVAPKLSKEIQARVERRKRYKKHLARLLYEKYKRAMPRVKKQMIANSRHYARVGSRYEISDWKRYYRRHRPKRALIHFENKFMGPRFNYTLAEAEVFIERDRRRKKAAIKRLRDKRRQQRLIRKQKSAKLSTAREQLNQAQQNGATSVSSGDQQPSSYLPGFVQRIFGGNQSQNNNKFPKK